MESFSVHCVHCVQCMQCAVYAACGVCVCSVYGCCLCTWLLSVRVFRHHLCILVAGDRWQWPPGVSSRRTSVGHQRLDHLRAFPFLALASNRLCVSDAHLNPRRFAFCAAFNLAGVELAVLQCFQRRALALPLLPGRGVRAGAPRHGHVPARSSVRRTMRCARRFATTAASRAARVQLAEEEVPLCLTFTLALSARGAFVDAGCLHVWGWWCRQRV